MSEQPRLEGIMEHWVFDSVYFFPLMGPCNNFYRNFVTDFFEKKTYVDFEQTVILRLHHKKQLLYE